MMKRIVILMIMATMFGVTIAYASGNDEYIDLPPEIERAMDWAEAEAICGIPGCLPVIGAEWAFNKKDDPQKGYYWKTFLIRAGQDVEAFDLVITADGKTFFCQNAVCQKLKLD